MIGGALRNAGMRFGEAVDHWHKGDQDGAQEAEGAPQKAREAGARRAAFYTKAEFMVDTSAQALEPSFAALRSTVRQALGLPR